MAACLNAGVAVEFAVRIPPKTLDDRMAGPRVSLPPGDCE
jgi:hypothetical protein